MKPTGTLNSLVRMRFNANVGSAYNYRCAINGLIEEHPPLSYLPDSADMACLTYPTNQPSLETCPFWIPLSTTRTATFT
jgi:hypothetical protein